MFQFCGSTSVYQDQSYCSKASLLELLVSLRGPNAFSQRVVVALGSLWYLRTRSRHACLAFPSCHPQSHNPHMVGSVRVYISCTSHNPSRSKSGFAADCHAAFSCLATNFPSFEACLLCHTRACPHCSLRQPRRQFY